MEIWKVSELNKYVKGLIDSQYAFRQCFITGTVSNLKRHSNGCYYFSLKDEMASIDVTIFSNYVRGQSFAREMENGLEVTLRGSLNFYEKLGRMSFLCQEVIIGQKSNFQLAYEALKNELTALGYFDESHKLPIPVMAKCIGLVTSESGAVLHDILHIAAQRNPLVQFKLFSVPVQGESAPPYIAKGIEAAASDPEVDLIILGRGGGSMEDLWCFNDRLVVEAIYSSQTPLISAIGHETDYTLSDFVADKRGATPSHAAEMAIYPLWQLQEDLRQKQQFLQNKMEKKISMERQRLERLFHQKLGLSLVTILHQEKQKLDEIQKRIESSTQRYMAKRAHELALLVQKLDLLNPLSLMVKGYTKVSCNGAVIRSVDELSVNEKIEVTFNDGKVKSCVEDIEHYGK